MDSLLVSKDLNDTKAWIDYLLTLPLYIQIPFLILLFIFLSGKFKIKPLEFLKPLHHFIEDLFISERKKNRLIRDTESRKRIEHIEQLLIIHAEDVKELDLEVNNFFDTYSINNKFSSQLRKDLTDVMKDLSLITTKHNEELGFLYKHQDDIKNDVIEIKDMLNFIQGVVNAKKE